MSDEKLKFKDMLSSISVIDSNDRIKTLGDCIESEYQELISKINEYNQDGEINIKLKFKVEKKSKNGLIISGEVTKKSPKGIPQNMFYRDTRTNGLYFDNPDQIKLFPNNVKQFPNSEEAKQQ